MAQLNQVIDWDSFTELLLPTYPGLAEEGRPPLSARRGARQGFGLAAEGGPHQG
mgnify:CR=1 FL=1